MCLRWRSHCEKSLFQARPDWSGVTVRAVRSTSRAARRPYLGPISLPTLAYAFEQLGDLDSAEARLAEATGIGGLEHGFYWAKLR